MRVAIVGGGIAGLTAALECSDRLGPDAEITVIDGAAHLGGKLRTGGIGGYRVETGAETFLARAADDPGGAPSAAIELAHRVGLGDALRYPATTAAAILVDGDLAAIPGGTLMGVPVDPSTMDGRYGPADRPDADTGRPVLGPGEDISVGALARARVGDAIVDRLIDPLLGGVYAGRADDLSLAVTMPGLAASCRTEHTLRSAVRATLARRSTAPGPVFATVDGGLTALVDAVVAAMPRVRVRLGLPVRELTRTAGGWQLVIGSTRAPETLDVDAVVLAVPARPAARLLAVPAPDEAALIGRLDYASIGLMTYALPAGALDHTALAGRSGALIPAVAGRLIKAVTVFSTKWGPQPDGTVVLRVSIGRYGDEAVLQRADDDLIVAGHDDLAKIVGAPLPAPLAASLTRWGGALPQYTPGHLGRVAEARAGLPATIALAGAVCDGVGIPVCVTSGRAAADQIIIALGG
jgi:protoporphyrinogen/coproporphyrinogen III oxidase